MLIIRTAIRSMPWEDKSKRFCMWKRKNDKYNFHFFKFGFRAVAHSDFDSDRK